MTSIINQRVEFGGITAMGGPLASPLVAIAGPRHTILRAAKSGGQMVLLGESEDLGAEPLAVDNTSATYHVLTAAGMTRVSAADAPVIVSETAFDPGDGRWIINFTNGVATPLKQGGIQTLHPTTGAVITKFPSIMQDSRFAAGLRSEGFLWVVDGRAAQIHTFLVNTTTGTMQYIGKVAAPNCRDIVKVVLDGGNGNLFVVCRKRLVRFTVPFAAVTDVEDLLPTFAEDYGVQTYEYTDLAVLGTNEYWIGTTSATADSPLDFSYGPMFGIWDNALGDNGELIVAAPKVSLLTVNNVVPFVDADGTSGEILPAAPAISSALTSAATEGVAWTYTITTTGSGSAFSSPDLPSWATLNAATGEISGTPTTVGTVNITIVATNAGGSDTETLVVTVAAAIADFSAVAVNNGSVYAVHVDGPLVYIGGDFTSVTDSSGTYTRNRVACVNISTGLWTSWNPGLSGGTVYAIRTDGTHVYVGGNFSAATIGGATRTHLCRISPSTGLTEAWNPTVNGEIRGICIDDKVYVCGNFSSLNGSARVSNGAYDLNGSLSSWTVNTGGNFWANSGGTTLYTVADAGSYVLLGGLGRISLLGVQQAQRFVYALKTDGTAPLHHSSLASGTVWATTPSGYVGGVFSLAVTPPGSATTTTRNNAANFPNGGFGSFDPNFGATVYSLAEDGSSSFWGGSFSSVGGVTSTSTRKFIKITSGGVRDTNFANTWSTTVGTVLGIAVTGDAVIAVGDFTDSFNGVAKSRILVAHKDTGALY